MAAFSGLGKMRREPRQIHVIHETVGIPLKYFPVLASCEFAGALGLVLGVWWPLLGMAAGIGLVQDGLDNETFLTHTFLDMRHDGSAAGRGQRALPCRTWLGEVRANLLAGSGRVGRGSVLTRVLSNPGQAVNKQQSAGPGLGS